MRGTTTALLIAAVLAVVFVWVAKNHDQPTRVSSSGVRSAAPRTTGPAPTSSAASNASTDELPRHGPYEVNVCGIGWMAPGSDGRIDEEAILKASGFRETKDQIVARLVADHDPFTRLAGTVLQTLHASPDRATSLQEQACEGANCPDVLAFLEKRIALAERLARLAVSTTDPRVYAYAVSACQSDIHDGSCANVNAAQWMRLDPENGEPWLFALGEASTKKDQAAIDDALFHISHAKRFGGQQLAIADEVSRHVGQDAGEIAAGYQLAIEAIGIDAAQASPPLQALSRACSSEALRDGNRRQLCDEAASAVVARTTSLIEALIASNVGRRLGWPADRADAARGLGRATSESLRDENTDGLGVLGANCEHLSKGLRSISSRARTGEVQQTRDWLQSTGQSLDSFMKADREFRRSAAEQATSSSGAAR